MTHASSALPAGAAPSPSAIDVLRRFIRDAPTALAMLDTELRYVAASTAWCRVFGLPEEGLEGRSHTALFPNLPARFTAAHERALSGYVERCDADPIETPDGQPGFCRWEIRPWYTECGEVGGITIFKEDITERVNSHHSLVESERRLRFALDASKAGAWSVDLRSGVVRWDARARAFLGFGSEQGDSLEAVIGQFPADYQAYKRRRLESIERDINDNEWDELVNVPNPDGSIRWVHEIGRVERNEQGEAIGLAGLMFDVTEQRRADQSLRLALSAGAASAWVWRPDSDSFEFDERGVNPDQVPVGAPTTREVARRHIHPDDRARMRSVMEHVRDTNGDGWDVEYRVLLPEGGVRWRRSLGKSERDLAGKLVSVSSIATDITARKEAEIELERSHASLREHAAELERRTQQLRRLASDLTLAEQRAREQLAKTLHDHLQQLLFSARMNMERAAESCPDPTLLEQAQLNLRDAIASARSLSVELFPPVLHQGDFPESLAWLADHEQRTCGITVETHLCPNANPAGHDVRLLLFESVRELLFNAAKHAHVDRVRLDAAVDTSGQLAITVSDEGEGFDPSTQADLHAGGLGLRSIRERITLLGGTFEIDSAPGKGARFTLRVPAAASPRRPQRRSQRVTAAPAGATRPPSVATAEGDGRPLRILIADDHVLVRAGLREQLARYVEFRVVGEATDGLDAVTKTGTLAPDVVIMDVSMPVLDGVEATARIRTDWPFISVIGLSAQDSVVGSHAIERAGASAYFSKTEGVTDMIAHLLAIHAARLASKPA